MVQHQRRRRLTADMIGTPTNCVHFAGSSLGATAGDGDEARGGPSSQVSADPGAATSPLGSTGSGCDVTRYRLMFERATRSSIASMAAASSSSSSSAAAVASLTGAAAAAVECCFPPSLRLIRSSLSATSASIHLPNRRTSPDDARRRRSYSHNTHQHHQETPASIISPQSQPASQTATSSVSVGLSRRLGRGSSPPIEISAPFDFVHVQHVSLESFQQQLHENHHLQQRQHQQQPQQQYQHQQQQEHQQQQQLQQQRRQQCLTTDSVSRRLSVGSVINAAAAFGLRREQVAAL